MRGGEIMELHASGKSRLMGKDSHGPGERACATDVGNWSP